MNNEILIIYGSLNSVPSPEGAAPAKIIEETVNHLNNSKFKVLSNTNVKLEKIEYQKNTFQHVKYNGVTRLLFKILRIRYPYKKRKELFITASPQQLEYFIAVCLYVRKHAYKKVIVHVSPGLVQMLAKFCPKVEIVFYHHGTSLHTKLSENQWVRLQGNTKAIFGVNNAAKIRANETFKHKIANDKYISIKNAISQPNPIMYNPDKNNNNERFIFLYSGRICPEKGILNLLKAFQKTFEKNKNIELIIAGGAGGGYKVNLITSYMKECFAFAKEHYLPVHFTGYLSKNTLYSKLNQIDVVILPTDIVLSEEGMPLSLIEAMSFAKPIISTDVGGCKEIISNSKNGFLITQYPYVEAMCNAMLRIAKDKKLYEKMSMNARQRYIQDHTYEAYIKNFLLALKSINFI